MTLPQLSACLLAMTALVLGSCARTAIIHQVTPRYTPITPAQSGPGAPVSPLRAVTADLDAAPALLKRTPLQAGEKYVAALQSAAAELDRNPGSVEARNLYNFALERIFSLIRAQRYEPWGQPFAMGRYTIQLEQAPRYGWDPRQYDFQPDDQVELGGKYITERVVRDGLGATLVAIGRQPEQNFLKNFSMARNYYGVTAVAEFRGTHCGISFHDPVDDSKVRMGRHTYTLAADFTTSLAILLSRELPEKLGLLRLLDPDKYADSARMIRLRPYNDDRIPLLLVHGLMDSPATWVPLINALRADPVLRSRYQIWAYSYPSGYPYPYTAALLRRELDRAKTVFPNHKPIVAVGHSMGGIISRLMLTDSGDAIWDAYFHRPPEEVRMSAKQKALMEEMLIFKSRDDIARAIFLNSPHRGAEMAGNWVGKLGRKLIRVPKFMISLGDAVRQVVTLSEGGMAYEDLPTSIDSLTPSNLFVKTVVGLPLNPRIPFHSIIGDRGKPNAREHPELGSDGFVPYWSSHLEGARSEKIIPSNHTGHQSPEGIAEVLRLLHLHLKTAR